MGTTANIGLPYPEGTDLVIAGDDVIQALAEALDGRLKDQYAVGRNPGSASLPHNADTLIGYSATEGTGLTYSAGVFTYIGSARWFMVAFGGNVANGGTVRSSRLRLLADAAVYVSCEGGDVNYGFLGTALPVYLVNGTTLSMDAWVNNSASSAGTITDAYLRVAGM